MALFEKLLKTNNAIFFSEDRGRDRLCFKKVIEQKIAGAIDAICGFIGMNITIGT